MSVTLFIILRTLIDSIVTFPNDLSTFRYSFLLQLFIIRVGLLLSLYASSNAEKFPSIYSPYFLCSGVVNYDFYLPPNESMESLNLKAISMMNPSWGFLNAHCKSDMKRLVCAMVYLPTSPGTSSHKQPCKSLCDATTYLGTSCAGMMEAFGTSVNCSSELFDSSNNPELCNAMEFTEVSIYLSLPILISRRTNYLWLSLLKIMLVKFVKVLLMKLLCLQLIVLILLSHHTYLLMLLRYLTHNSFDCSHPSQGISRGINSYLGELCSFNDNF